MTQTIFTATSEYVNEINELPVKRQVSVSGILILKWQLLWREKMQRIQTIVQRQVSTEK